MGRRQVYDRDAIFKYLVEFKQCNDGNSPTNEQIADQFGMESVSTAQKVLFELESERRIRLVTYGHIRHIIIPGGKWTYTPPTRLRSGVYR